MDTPAHRADSCSANRRESILLRTGSNNTMTFRRSRWAVAVFFFINGAALASWVPHIPAVKSRHMLTDGALGLVLLSMAAGSVLTLPMAGWLVGRLGSRVMTAGAGIALCLALPLPVASPSVAMLSLSLGFLGACNALLDVSMNAQAAEVEQRMAGQSCRRSTRFSAWAASLVPWPQAARWLRA